MDIRSGELWESGAVIQLEPQPFQVLALLVERSGDLVTRDEIRTAVWSDGTTVAFDLSLNYCNRQVRLALRDDARQPRYLETVPKRGYRFLAAVQAVREAAERSPKVQRLPKNPEAVKPFREAEHLSTTWELEKTKQAAQLYRDVIRLAPEFPDTYAALANALVILPFMGDPRDPAEAEQMALQAISMDDSLALAHVALGHGYWHQWKWEAADSSFRRGVGLDPECVAANQLYGLYLVTCARCEEAIRYARKAAELEPTSGVILYSLAHIYLQAEQFEEAIQQNLQTLLISRHYPSSYASLVRAYAMKGDLPQLEQVLDEWERVSGAHASGTWRSYWLARCGKMDQARVAYDEWSRRASPAGRVSLSAAIALVALEDFPGALSALEEGVRQHGATLIWLKVAPELQVLRTHPRYRRLLESMGFPS